MFMKIIILTLFGVCLGSRSANQFIDNVLQTSFPNELRSLRLDPAPLPSFNVKFGTGGIYRSQGEADFVNGNATGFSRLRRQYDCQGPKYYFQQYSINCTLSLYSMVTNYNVRVRNGSRIYNVRNMGHVSETLIDVKIVGQIVGALKSFQITRFGQVNPTFNGLPTALNPYVKVLQDGYRAQVSTYLFNTIRDKVKYAFERALINRPIPRQ